MNPNKKEVKSSFNPPQQKEAKHKQNVQSYLNNEVSWQLGDIDFEGSWHGFIRHHHFKFEINDEIIASLVKHNAVSVANANTITKCLEHLHEKEFHSISDFFTSFHERTNCEIPSDLIACISTSIKDFYFWREIFPQMKSVEKMTWDDLSKATHGSGKTNSHFIECDKLEKDAKRRLKELKLDDIEEIYSLRIGGIIRIYGFRKCGYLKILWFDLDHAICKSDIQARGKNFS